MKMQNFIKSVIAGKIKKISVERGDRIGKGTLLLEIDPD